MNTGAFERGLIRQASPVLLEAKARELVEHELSKGCIAALAPSPVALEPPFQPIRSPSDLVRGDDQLPWTHERPPDEAELVRLRVWVAPDQKCDWARSEMLLRQLQGAQHRVGFELAGNSAGITLDLRCHQRDLPTLSGAFAGAFESCEIRVLGDRPLPGIFGRTVLFFDYAAPPPYPHLFTRPGELPISPYATIIRTMMHIEPPGFALYQVVFQPVAPSHDWHRNVHLLLDLEFLVKLNSTPLAVRYAQQTPSGDLRRMAADTETKAHDDKPFYAAAVRLAVFDGETAARHLQAMGAFSGLIQHGGRPLSRLDESSYAALLDGDGLRDMFARGLTYRPGFLVNSAELTSLVHLPPMAVLEQRQAPIQALEILTPSDALAHGSPLGHCDHAGRLLLVCIPPEQRFSHTHVIGRPGEGKSTNLEHVILDDIERGDGVAVIDPQGHLIERLMQLLPERYVERTIYVDFADPDVVPIFNPLHTTGRRRDQLADEIVVAFKSFVTGWGDRLEHLLRMTILGLLHLPHTSLLDVANALRTKSAEAETLSAAVLKVADGELLRGFWRDDLEKYARADLTPPQHKLSKLLSAGPLALTLSQPDSLIDLRQVMDEGKILLLNLKNVGDEVGGFAGSLWLSLLRAAALTRDVSTPDGLRPFHIHVDEAQRFVTRTLEQIVTETRKFRMSITLAHHYLSQFEVKQRDALSSAGSTIIRNVDSKDAAHLCKDLQGRVGVPDITKLDRTTAIARVGTEVVRFKTLPPRERTGPSQRAAIIAHSRKHYYRTAAEVKRAIRNRGNRWQEPFAPLTPAVEDIPVAGSPDEELHYDEF